MAQHILERRPLGKTGLQVSVVSLGAAPFARVDDEVAARTAHRALELGVNLIDTSPLYGDGESERKLGLALEAWYAQGGRRTDFILCTKTGTRSRPYDYSADATRWSIDQSLRTLKTDYLDLVHVHDPDRLEPALGPGGALEALQELQRQGVVRHVGLGVRDLDLHCAFHATGCCAASLTYRDYSLISQSAADRLLPSAQRHQVGLLNAQMVRHGLLGGEEEPAAVAHRFSTRPGFQPGEISYIEPWEVERATRLWHWCRDRKLDLLALSVQFGLRDPRISSQMIGTGSPDHLEAGVRAAVRPIAPEVWQELAADFEIRGI